MSPANVTSTYSLEALLKAGIRRILRQRPARRAVEIRTNCDVAVSISEAVRILAVVREAIYNSIDHAHPVGVPGRILVTTLIDGRGRICIEVADDGVGLPEGFDPRMDGAEGFQIMRRTSAELGSELIFETSSLGLAVGLAINPLVATSRIAS